MRARAKECQKQSKTPGVLQDSVWSGSMTKLAALVTLVLLFGLIDVARARADEITGRFVSTLGASTGARQKISGLSWNSKDKIPVVTERVDGIPQTLAILEGVYKTKGASLVWGTHKIESTRTGSFQLKVPLTSRTLVLEMYAVNSWGAIERETFNLFFQNWRPPQGKKDAKELFFTPGIGLTAISYKQPDLGSLDELALTMKISGDYRRLFSRWSLGASFYYSFLPISSSLLDTRLRFFGANLRIGYLIPFRNSPWTLTLMSGAYYATSFATPAAFGYHNLIGPQLFPVFRRALNGSGYLSGYMKFSPIMTGLSFLSLSSSELAFGAGYGLTSSSSGHTMGVTLDVSLLRLALIPDGAVRSRSMTLGIAYSY